MPLKNIFSAILLPLFVTLLFASHSSAASQFRQDYVKALEANNFTALEYLGRTGKNDIPVEVKALLKEAAAAEVFDDKMHLIDIAASMAAMYQHWHGSDRFVVEVEAFQKEEIKKENARVAELQKWSRLEAVPGNLVMRVNLPKMEAKGLRPVLFPHWVHRLLYDCKACHQELFSVKRGTNGITQAKLAEGKLCGVCHNGTVSFSAKDDCERCHRAGKPGDESLLDPSKYDLKRIKSASTRVGSSWNPEKLKEGRFPVDRFGLIDWTALKESGAYAPVRSLDKGAKDEVRDNNIYFEPKLSFVKGVVFNHRTHSLGTSCSTCHPEIFRDTLGATPAATSLEMSAGASCGACHGRVAFKMADCNRCHTVMQGQGSGGALKRTSAGK